MNEVSLWGCKDRTAPNVHKAHHAKLKETVKGGDIDAIKADTEALQKAFYPIAEKIYAQQSAQNGAANDGGATGADGNYYDAGFEDKTGN